MQRAGGGGNIVVTSSGPSLCLTHEWDPRRSMLAFGAIDITRGDTGRMLQLCGRELVFELIVKILRCGKERYS